MQPLFGTNYEIHFGENGYTKLNEILAKNNYSKLFILVDENATTYCLNRFLANLETTIVIEIIEIESGEENKCLNTCMEVWSALSDLEGDRKSIVLNLGGGVITDLGGFVACTFKRGIDFINIPTTLLGMVDASIGGKNGVDIGALKNQIGIIREPKMVLIDTQFLETLPPKQMRSGLAEMLKHGLIADQIYWNKFKKLSNLASEDLEQLVYESIQIKNTIVCEDLTETGIRKALNFGHTIGHAIESFFLMTEDQEPLLHGEAIAIGIIIESYFSKKLGLITNETYQEIKYIITDFFKKISFSEKDIEDIIELLIYDKKNEYGKVQFVVLDGIGKIKIVENISNELIFSAFEDYQK